MNNRMSRLFSFDETSAVLQESRALREARELADHEIAWGEDVAELQDACISVMAACDADGGILRRHMEGLTIEFSREKRRWKLGEERRAPHVVAEHLGKAQLYRMSGLAALLMECWLSGYVLRSNEYDWFWTVLIAVGVTAMLAAFAHGIIKLATERETLRESAEVIRKRVFWPFLYVTLPALAVFLFVRVLSGGDQSAATQSEGDWFGLSALFDSLMGALSSIFDFALWLATLGLVPLGAALLALADHYDWSRRACDTYDQLARRLAELKNIRAKYYTAMRTRATPRHDAPEGPEPPLPSGPSAPSPYLMLLLALCLPFGLAACSQKPRARAQAPASSVKTAPPASPTLLPVAVGAAGTELHVKIDRTGSVKADAAAIVASNLHGQLPALIQALQADRLGLAYFADKGWNAPESVSIALPRAAEIGAPRVPGGRLPPHLQERINKQNEKALLDARQRAAAKHQADIRQALAGLDVDALNAAIKASAPCTDLLGVLSRIGATERSGRHFYLIVTDGFSTCKQKTAVVQPSGNVTVLVLLATAVPGESGGVGDTDQYFSRKAALLKVAPWLVIVPADEGDLASYLNGKRAAEKLAAAQP